MEFLKVDHLYFRYAGSDEDVLKDLSFTLDEGEFLVICGSSGCGKSTLLKLLKCELAPNGEKQGAIYYKEREIEAFTKRERCEEIGFVMQNPSHQIVMDSVWHELAFGLENLGLDQRQIRLRVGEMASFFGLQNLFYQDCDRLSGGFQQTLNLASVLCMHPKLILLDEATSQLDPIAASKFLETLSKIHQEFGTSIILVEHRLESLFAIADKIAVMDHGTMLCVDTLDHISKMLRSVSKDHPMRSAFPLPVRLYDEFSVHDDKTHCPLTIQEGRRYIKNHFDQRILCLKDETDSGERYEIQKGSRTSDKSAVLSFHHVYFRYDNDGDEILRDFSFDLCKGVLHAIVGGNGSGKTTMLKAAGGLLKIKKGKVTVEKDHAFGYVPQDPTALFVKDTLYEDLRCVGDETAVDEVMAQFHIDGLKHHHPYDLSGGEQQKAALAKVMLTGADIYLLDEPAKGLDHKAREDLGNMLKTLVKQGASILMVTHDIEFAARFADQCSMFFDMQIIASGTPKEVFKDHRFYTTAARKLSVGIYEDAITAEEVMELCRLNVKNTQ